MATSMIFSGSLYDIIHANFQGNKGIINCDLCKVEIYHHEDGQSKQFTSWTTVNYKRNCMLECYSSAQTAMSFLQVSKFKVSCSTSLGNLVLIELDKQSLPLFPEVDWFCAKVEVKSPEGDIYSFPVYRWIADSKVHRFKDGKGLGNCAHLKSCSNHCRCKTKFVMRLKQFPNTVYTIFTRTT